MEKRSALQTKKCLSDSLAGACNDDTKTLSLSFSLFRDAVVAFHGVAHRNRRLHSSSSSSEFMKTSSLASRDLARCFSFSRWNAESKTTAATGKWSLAQTVRWVFFFFFVRSSNSMVSSWYSGVVSLMSKTTLHFCTRILGSKRSRGRRLLEEGWSFCSDIVCFLFLSVLIFPVIFGRSVSPRTK